MGVKVVVSDAPSLQAAIRLLRRRVARLKPRYHLRREGYYLKPSVKRRRKRNNAKLTARRSEYWHRVLQRLEPIPRI